MSMIIDDLRIEEDDGTREHSARVRWDGGEQRLRFSGPAALSVKTHDGSPYLVACLLQAMRRGEDLEVAAPVSRRLLGALDEIQTIYATWAPSLRRASVRVAGAAPEYEAADGVGCFFSRGVDATYQAASAPAGRITHLVFIADLDPINDVATRGEEIRLAREVADRLGKPLVVAGTNLRPLADPVLDWADLFGAGLAAVAHCLDGGLGQMVIPSSCDWATFGPCGSSPVLDHLFSTEGLRVEHGAMGEGRHGKVAWLAEHRPDLLPFLKVCYRENRADNCGRCRKCLWTMACLEAAGALELATSFPDRIDHELVRSMRLSDLPLRLFWRDTAEALEAAETSPRLVEAIRHALRRSTRPSIRERLGARIASARGREPEHDPRLCRSPILFYRNQTNAALEVLRN